MAGKPVGTIFVELDLDASRYTKGQQRLLKDATSTSLNIEQNFKNLGIKSSAEMNLMRAKIVNSFNMIANNSKATANDIIRAEEAKNAKLKALNEQQYGAHVSMLDRLKKHWFAVSAVATAAVAGAVAMINKGLEAADAIGKTADKVGLSTRALQEYQFAARLSGISTDTLNNSLERFTRQVGEAVQGKGKLKDTLIQYGIAVTDASGRTRDISNIMGDLADVIRSTRDPSERLRIAFKAFGQEGAAMVNMLRDGRSGMDAFRAEAHRLGLVLEDDLIRNSEKANDELDKLKLVMTTTFTRVVAENANEIAAAVQAIAIAMAGVAKYAGLRSVFNTFTEGAELAKKGLLDWQTFIHAGFIERQKMVDDILAKMDQISAHEQFRLGQVAAGAPRAAARRVIPLELPEIQKPAELTAEYRELDDEIKQLNADVKKGMDEFGESLSAITPLQEALIPSIRESTLVRMEEARALEALTAATEQYRTLQEFWGFEQYDTLLINQSEKTFSEMIELTERTAWSMQQNFSDFFFDAITGKLRSLEDYATAVFESMARAASDFFSQQIVQGLFGELNKAGGGGGLLGSLFSTYHSGGIVGETATASKRVNPAVFIGAPRLHGGLMADEFPAILQRGERVIPKNVAGAAPAVQINIVNKGTAKDTQQSAPLWDGRQWVIGIVMEDIANNGPLRGTIKGLR